MRFRHMLAPLAAALYVSATQVTPAQQAGVIAPPNTGSQPQQQPQVTGPPCPPVTPPAVVTAAYNVQASNRDSRRSSDTAATSGDVRLRDVIAVRVRNLSTLRAQSDCASRDGRARKVVLYLDGRPLADMVAYPPTDPDSAVLLFPLQRTEASREVWTHILGKPRLEARRTQVSVGVDDRFAIPSEAFLRFEVLPRRWLIVWVLVLAGFVAAFIWLARASDVLRDPATVPTSAEKRPYSLATMQASWWFFVILASYVFIGLVTADFSTSITGTVLVLLGISAATKVGGSLVDATKDTPEQAAKEAAAITAAEGKMREISARIDVLTDASATDPTDEGAMRALAEEMSLKKTTMSRLRKLRNESEGFVRDLLSDANGVNFHRFQMAGWTVVLSIVFLTQVYRELAMPQFSETLLGLMGISAGTYLGLKATEPTVPTPPA